MATEMVETKKKSRSKWRSFEDARAFARSLGLQSRADWKVWTKSSSFPHDIPVAPNTVYKHCGWAGWGDSLGTRSRKGGFQSFPMRISNKDLSFIFLANIFE